MKFNLNNMTAASILLVAGLVNTDSAAARQGWNYYVDGFVAAGKTNFDYTALDSYSASASDDMDQHYYATGITDFSSMSSQNGVGYGLALGVSRYLCQNQLLGLQVSAQFNSRSAEIQNSWNLSSSSLNDDDHGALPENIDNSFRLKYQINFPVIYGFELFNQDNWFYFKAGLSIAKLKESAFNSIDFYHEESNDYYVGSHMNTSGSERSVWGSDFGAGVRHYFDEHMMLFVEYDYYYFGKRDISTLSQNFTIVSANDSGRSLISTGSVTRKVKIASSAFKVGFGYEF